MLLGSALKYIGLDLLEQFGQIGLFGSTNVVTPKFELPDSQFDFHFWIAPFNAGSILHIGDVKST